MGGNSKVIHFAKYRVYGMLSTVEPHLYMF